MNNNSNRILVVDDNRINRLKLGRALKTEGYEVLEAAGGREALEILQSETVDLVLLDLLMPEVDGFQVLEQMKSDQNTGLIPVIMVTAVDEKEDVNKCLSIGAVDYITKPFDPVVLTERVRCCLDKGAL